MISEFDVEMAYKYLLGRQPENREVVMEKAQSHSTVDDMLRAMYVSEEFKERLARMTG